MEPDLMYGILSDTLTRVGEEILGLTQAQAKPKLTDELYGQLQEAKRLRKIWMQ